jgi:predicted PurR-regulated permease PerM
MHDYTLQYIYLGFVTLVFGGLLVMMFKPFLGPILFAAVMAVMLESVYRYIRTHTRLYQSIAAGCVLLFTMLFVLLPIGIVAVELFAQSQQLYQSYQAGNTPNLFEIANQIEVFVQGYIPQFSLEISEYVATLLNWLTSNLGTILSSTFSVVIDLILFVFALFFFVRDGDTFAQWYRRMSPLADDRDMHLLQTLKVTVNSVIRGTIIIAVIQGIVAGIGFAIFGIPNVVLWGTLAAISAIVPGLGVGLVFIPMIAYLIIIGHVPAALGLAAWGGIIVGLVDNALVPYFYTKGLSLHPMFILFAVLGGVSLIGPFGFIFGPLVLATVSALAEVYTDTHDAAGKRYTPAEQ